MGLKEIVPGRERFRSIKRDATEPIAYLKTLYKDACDTFEREKSKREARRNLVAECAAANKKVPRDPSINTMMFRFGVPDESTSWGSETEAEMDANVHEAARVDTAQRESVATEGLADEDDDTPVDADPNRDSDNDCDDILGISPPKEGENE